MWLVGCEILLDAPFCSALSAKMVAVVSIILLDRRVASTEVNSLSLAQRRSCVSSVEAFST